MFYYTEFYSAVNGRIYNPYLYGAVVKQDMQGVGVTEDARVGRDGG